MLLLLPVGSWANQGKGSTRHDLTDLCLLGGPKHALTSRPAWGCGRALLPAFCFSSRCSPASAPVFPRVRAPDCQLEPISCEVAPLRESPKLWSTVHGPLNAREHSGVLGAAPPPWEGGCCLLPTTAGSSAFRPAVRPQVA